jgi:hypothetical protein
MTSAVWYFKCFGENNSRMIFCNCYWFLLVWCWKFYAGLDSFEIFHKLLNPCVHTTFVSLTAYFFFKYFSPEEQKGEIIDVLWGVWIVLLPNDPQWNLDHVRLNARTKMHVIFRPKVIDFVQFMNYVITRWTAAASESQVNGCTEVYTTACIC